MTTDGAQGPVVLEFDLRELDKFRQLPEHREIAMTRAMDYCATHQIHPPQWLVEEAAKIMIELLKREKPTRRGRTAHCIARLQHEFWDAERWSAVKRVQEIRAKCRRDDEVLKEDPNLQMSESWKKHHAKRKQWLKQGTELCAAKLLLGRDSYASPSAVYASYKKLEALAKGPTPPAGAWFDDAFLEKLGLQRSDDLKGGRNPFDIFDEK